MQPISFKHTTKITISYLIRGMILSGAIMIFGIILGIIFMSVGNGYFGDHPQWKAFLTYCTSNGVEFFTQIGPKSMLVSYSRYLVSLLLEGFSLGLIGILVFKKIYLLDYGQIQLHSIIPKTEKYIFWLRWYAYTWLVTLPIKFISDYIMAHNDQNFPLLLSNIIIFLIISTIIDSKVLLVLLEQKIQNHC